PSALTVTADCLTKKRTIDTRESPSNKEKHSGNEEDLAPDAIHRFPLTFAGLAHAETVAGNRGRQLAASPPPLDGFMLLSGRPSCVAGSDTDIQPPIATSPKRSLRQLRAVLDRT